MQKLFTPILIILLLSASLFAEERTEDRADDRAEEKNDILVDKEILYWRPQGADIVLPEVFYTPALVPFPYGAWKTSLVPELSLPEEEEPFSESREQKDLSFTAPEWEPPGLTLNGEKNSRRNGIELYASKPYGIGVEAWGGGESFGYELEGNGAVDDDYPHWGRLLLKGAPGSFDFKTAAGINKKDEMRLLSLLQGGVSFGREGIDQRVGLRWKSDSHEIDKGLENNSWGTQAEYGIILLPGDLQLDLGIEGEYLSEMSFNAYRISPEMTLGYTHTMARGDLIAEGGLLTDYYPEDPEDSAFFPDISLSYIRYDDFSFGLEYTNESIDEETLFRFLLIEPPVIGDFGFYRWHRGSVNWSGRLGAGWASLEGGACFGDMPRFADGALFPDKAILGFTELEWTYPLKKGMVTEFMLYADYEDTGDLRFLLSGGWIFSASSGRVYELKLRGGDRGIIRGYQALMNDSSDLLTGVGGGVEFSSLLKLEGELDYVPMKGIWEAAMSLVYRY